MTRRHGRSPRGIRLIAKLPHGRWRTLTFLAALRCDRIAAPCVIDGPIVVGTNDDQPVAGTLSAARCGCETDWRQLRRIENVRMTV